jgi:predicted transcriptional regulator
VIAMVLNEPTDSTDTEADKRSSTQPTIDMANLDATLSNLAYLVQSPTRLQILDQLQRSPCSTTELHNTLNVHRTTLQRNLDTLCDKQCIQRASTDDTYRLAPPGQLFIETFQQLLETARTATRLSTFLDHFPQDFPADVECLSTCDITIPEQYDPNIPLHRFSTLLTTSETVQLFMPIIYPKHIQTIADHLSDWSELELVSTASIFERLTTKQSSSTETVVRTGSVQLRTMTTSPSVGVGMMDETAVVIVYDEKQNIHALLETTSEQSAIVEWVRWQYRHHKRNAVPARSHAIFS